VTINDPAEYDVAVDVLRDLFGNERYTGMPTPELGSGGLRHRSLLPTSAPPPHE
jgi:hypothetical protein